jgi:hypothetical protein
MSKSLTVREFIEGYVKGTLGKKTVCGNWKIINWGLMDTLQYTTVTTERQWNDRTERRELITEKQTEQIAYKMADGSILMNSNQLKYVGRKMAWGREVRRYHEESQEQIWLRDLGCIPIPFTLFEETNTDVRDFSWIVKPIAEAVVLKNGNIVIEEQSRHFSGGCLFAIDNETYLFDIDRQELNHGIFNAFVTKLPSRVDTIKDAYDLLMPDEVKKAINGGIEVNRQGEFFFVKVSEECPVKVELTNEEKEILKFPPSREGFGISPRVNMTFISDDRDPYIENHYKLPLTNINTPETEEFQKYALQYKAIHDKYIAGQSIPGVLGKSSSGSHNVEKFVKFGDDTFVSGTVKQQRREHADLTLNGWFKVYGNTGTISWTITGNID